jgi:CDP-diacylglycerol--glycerol-3-phosphate 3-phosphatidyltransferase
LSTPSAHTIRQDILNVPNLLTMTRVVCIPVVIYLLDLASPSSCFWAALVFGLASATDYFDGWLARRMKLVSLTGQFLDPLADKLMVMACLVQLTAMGWMSPWIPILLLTRELAVQGLRQIASAEGLVIAAGQGGKWKTAFQLIGLIGLLAHFQYSINFWIVETPINFHRVGWWMLVISIAFSLWSGVEYFVGFLRSMDKAKSKA